MNPRPAKRQRRWSIGSSDSESDVQLQQKGSTARPQLQLETTVFENSRVGETRRPDSRTTRSSSRLNSNPPKALSSRTKFHDRPSQTSSAIRTGAGVGNGIGRVASSSPEKKKKHDNKRNKTKNVKREPDDSPVSKKKSLHSYFQPAPHEQRWSSKRPETGNLEQPLNGDHIEDGNDNIKGDDDDFIEDDYDSYDEIFTRHILINNEKGVGNVNSNLTGPGLGSSDQGRSSSFQARQLTDRNSNSKKRISNPAKRFILPPSPASKNDSRVSQVSESGVGTTEDDNRPWAQRYTPSDLEELAVHKRKVTDVANWLRDVFAGKNGQRLLVLRGPAGCGKTTTISLLSKSVGFDIVEWKNPSSTADFALRDNASAAAQFEEFLGQGDKFGSLDLDDTDDSAEDVEDSDASAQRRILLIEEFPTIVGRYNSNLAAFRTSLERYLATAAFSLSKGFRSGRAEPQTSPPVVIIVSETLLTSASSTADNFTVHKLLGFGIYNHPATTIIDFNSIAPTFMNKALRLVLDKDARRSKRTKIPGPAVLERISEIGDIRSAISSLEFLCLKDDKTGEWGGSISTKSKKAPRNNAALTSMEKESLEMITQREASLGIFHAVGRISYNKREDASLVPEGVEVPPPPPDYLRHYSRQKVSQVAVNELIDELGTDVQTFLCALHENYVLSCGGQSFTDSLDECIEKLSDSDILCADRRGAKASRAGVGIGATNSGTGVDMLRQEEISFQVATRGMLFSLPYPVNRRSSSVQGRIRDAYKMFYPTSLQLWSESERMDGLIDVWTRRSLDPFFSGQSHSADSMRKKPSGVQSWRNLGVGDAASMNRDDSPAMPVTMTSREDMLLYQLPYLAKISGREVDRGLEELTGFHGVEPLDHDDHDLTFEDSVDTPADDSLRPRISARGQASHAFGPRLPPSVEGEEKLVLSDDDIEDD